MTKPLLATLALLLYIAQPVIRIITLSPFLSRLIRAVNKVAAAVFCLIVPLGFVTAEEVKPNSLKSAHVPDINDIHPTNVYWGDTHVHTILSMDAGAMGTLTSPEHAYRFARGEEIKSTSGKLARLSEPLDFIALADHSDAMGTVAEIINGNPFFGVDTTVRRWQEMISEGGQSLLSAAVKIVGAFGASEGLPKILLDKKFASKVWEDYTTTADKFYHPGSFTTLIGFEWTSMPNWNNLHRVVIYRDGADLANEMLPAKVADGMDPEDLWKWMDAYESQTGGDVLAIPHNGNMSEGLMFSTARFDGSPMTREYVDERTRWEPLYETTQFKGDSETHPLLSPNDEFSDYETWDDGNFYFDGADEETLLGDYARSGLKRGLGIQASLGENPFKFGLIGSTDSHTGFSTPQEDNFFGKFVYGEPHPDRWDLWTETARRAGWEWAASGLTAVWASKNTREEIFDAMERREVYATTGSRIVLRFFGGWDYEPTDVDIASLAERGYEKGVPMGGDLPKRTGDEAPTFLVSALRAPNSGNLDRIQIVKGWLTITGELLEKVYNVAWSGGRVLDGAGKLDAVGNTVHVASATWDNTIGEPSLTGLWVDPDFDPSQLAFYYPRVIEIPTPRWTAYDSNRFGTIMPPEVPMVTQERAYGSPIWYTPANMRYEASKKMPNGGVSN